MKECSTEGCQLQWGRDRQVADRRLLETHYPPEYLLQWGRDRQVADRVPGFGKREKELARFNGAATVRSRIDALHAAGGMTDRMLQWGRDRQVADRPGAPTNLQGSAGLQWGRDRQVADRPGAPTNLQGSAGLQWGRDRQVADRRFADVTGAWQFVASMGPRPSGRG